MTPILQRRPRGVTLIELTIAVAISAIVLASLFGVVQSQQNAFFQGHLQRAAQGSARAALSFVEQRLATAGYGLDAPLAFDFEYYASAADPAPCPLASCPRDAVDGPDELVFYARNPRYWVPDDRSGAIEPSGYAWRVLAVDGSSITLAAREGDAFEMGRIVQLVCKTGESWAYVTLDQNVPRRTAAAGVKIALKPSSASNPFRRQAYAAATSCFTSGSARAFLIDRFRFHVRPVPVPGGVVPYLVLDTGLDVNGDGSVTEADETIVAEGIESFQVGYVMTNPALAPRGTIPGTQIALTPGTVTGASTTGTGLTLLTYDPTAAAPGQGEYEPTSWFRYAVGPTPAIADARLTDHQANIRAVRVAIVARGPDPDPSRPRADVLLPLLNQNALPAWIQPNQPYSRARVETTVPVRNMVARGMNDF